MPSEPMFTRLRATPWRPTFTWLGTLEETAHQINQFHEDYPLRVSSTIEAIENLSADNLVLQPGRPHIRPVLRRLHKIMFSDQHFGGHWRKINVSVGDHRPPDWRHLRSLMARLDRGARYIELRTVEDLTDWYTDFETVHPFQDGNGRVGGVVVAAYSHYLSPQRGWLAVEQ